MQTVEKKEQSNTTFSKECEDHDDKFGIISILHLIRCAVDVERQYEAIDAVDDLNIHPRCNVIPSDRPPLLLEYVSHALHVVIKNLDVLLEINTRGGSIYDPEYQNATEENS